MNRWNTKGLLSTLLLAALLALVPMTAPAFAQDSADDAVDTAAAGDATWYTPMWNRMQAGTGMMQRTMRGAAGTRMHMAGNSAGQPGAQHMGVGRHGSMHSNGMHLGGMMGRGVDPATGEQLPCPGSQMGNAPQACPGPRVGQQ